MTQRASDFLTLQGRILAWADNHGIFKHSNPKTQFLKTVSEVGELADSVAKGLDIRDDVGDILVTLVILTSMRGVTLTECLEMAWNEIKDREGRMVNGTFVKDGDV